MLRDFEQSDVLALVAYQSDPRYLEHYESVPDAGEIVSQAIEWAREDPRLNFQLAIELLTTGIVIGSVGLRRRSYLPGEAEVGFELAPEYWGQGYASECLEAILEFGSNKFQVSTFWAVSVAGNHRAHRVLGRLGFINSRVEAGNIWFKR